MDDENCDQYTISSFCAKSNALLEHADFPSFVKFVLTGVLDGRQAAIDATQDRMRHDEPINTIRDYDSLLGFHRDICIDKELNLHPISKFEDTLTRSIHIRPYFQKPEVSPH